MLIQGVVNKFGAVFIIIPEPIVGGMFCIMFGMISAFGNNYNVYNVYLNLTGLFFEQHKIIFFIS